MVRFLMTLQEKQDAIVEELNLIPDPMERLGYLVDRGKKARELEDDLKVDTFKIEGCLSQLWVVPEFRDGKCFYWSESDSAIVKGIASLLCEFYSGHAPEEIVSHDAAFLADAGITQHLSPNRRNGLSRITDTIQRFARSCLAA